MFIVPEYEQKMALIKRYCIPMELMNVVNHAILQIGFDFYILKSRSGIYDSSIVGEINFEFVDDSFIRDCVMSHRKALSEDNDGTFYLRYQGGNYLISGNGLQF